MSQKDIKVGLNKANVNAIAGAIGTATLNRLVPQFSTSVAYTKGQYTNYNNTLYRFTADKSAGAWDSTKVETASLNDLINDVNQAVEDVANKANVDGNYPTMTVGVADQLSPYDEESGDDQDEPFSFQATGTGNGTQPDFATGAIALMKEKQGNTVVVNSWLDATHYLKGNNATNVSVSGRTFTWQDTANNNNFIGTPALDGKANHKFIVNIKNKCEYPLTLATFNPFSQKAIIQANSEINIVIDLGSSNEIILFCGEEWEQRTYVAEINVVSDLTQWFNGDIPQDILDNPSNFFRYYQGSLAYNEGELVNANGRYIKCIGRNQWDEEWENGYYNVTTGEPASSDSYVRSKSINYIPIIPNTDYYFYVGTQPAGQTVNLVMLWYDKEHNIISYVTEHSNHIKSPANAVYGRFYLSNTAYGTTYNNDVTISLYYEDETGYDQYYPYEVLTNNDTGTEILRSAGSVKDYKEPDGTIHRLVGSVDLGTLTWSKQELGNSKYGFTAYLATVKPVESGSEIPNLACSKYVRKTRQQTYSSNEVGVSMWSTSTYICIYDSSLESGDAAAFKTAMSGVYLFYELATPTTEQGTPYSENLVIDDFGSMDFQGTNGVPQGNLIFYPVDYKAFIDTLYNYTEGTPSELALKSDLASDKSELQGVDTQLLNAIGGTLRQCLCVKETLDFEDTAFVDLGTLDWNVSSLGQATFGVAFADIESFNTPTSIAPILTTGVLNAAKWQDIYNGVVDNAISVDIQTLRVRATGKTLTEFKNSLKGVLLAYKKA